MNMRLFRVIPAALFLACAIAASSDAQVTNYVPPAASQGGAVTNDRLIGADREPQNWLTYSGTFTGQRYSKLAQVTPQNVKNLELAWVLQSHPPAEANAKYEASALVVNGIMYTVQPPNVVVALDAATGRVFWTYAYTPSPAARLCCGRVNRGMAILGNTLFMGTIDGNLVAIGARRPSAVDHPGRKAGGRLFRDGGAAGHQGQGDRGPRRRRIRHQRLPGRL
jgi:glucose dehydrogenase